MNFTELILKRRSIRKYKNKHIDEKTAEKIINAGLLAPSSRNLRSAELIVIRSGETLKKLADVKASGSAMLDGADMAVAVIGNSKKADAWIEDCSLALIYMQLAAAEAGVGSCWIQCRGRMSKTEGVSSEEFARNILAFPEDYSLEAIMSFGLPDEEKPACSADNCRIHNERF